LRASFVAFARDIVVADDAALDGLAGAFLAQIPGTEWGRESGPEVPVTDPLTFTKVEAALDAAGAQPVRAWPSLLENFRRSGGGFRVDYAAPLYEMKGEGQSQPYTLRVAPDDQARMYYRGLIEDPPGPDRSEHKATLASFMAALGRVPPSNVTFAWP
jgi:hypothetical protein